MHGLSRSRFQKHVFPELKRICCVVQEHVSPKLQWIDSLFREQVFPKIRLLFEKYVPTACCALITVLFVAIKATMKAIWACCVFCLFEPIIAILKGICNCCSNCMLPLCVVLVVGLPVFLVYMISPDAL
jgi:hypothetical protein